MFPFLYKETTITVCTLLSAHYSSLVPVSNHLPTTLYHQVQGTHYPLPARLEIPDQKIHKIRKQILLTHGNDFKILFLDFRHLSWANLLLPFLAPVPFYSPVLLLLSDNK